MEKNRVAIIIKYLGWSVIVVGVVITIYMNLPTEGKWGGYESPSNQVRIISLYILSGAFVSGITWLGFSEIINLLDKILRKE